MMSIALHVDEKQWELGSGSFVHAFFSTIAVRLEDGRWGSRYPVLMGQLYAGEVGPEHLAALDAELDEVVPRLDELPPAFVVWDAENPGARPPWGDAIAPTITSLANYWWTSDGHDLVGVLRDAVAAATASGEPIRIE
jgi:2,3-bisphosphoglycerate-dependent phosphoglycerate mutase